MEGEVARRAARECLDGAIWGCRQQSRLLLSMILCPAPSPCDDDFGQEKSCCVDGKVPHTLLALGSSCLSHGSGLHREVVLYRTGIVGQTAGLAFTDRRSAIWVSAAATKVTAISMVTIQNFFWWGRARLQEEAHATLRSGAGLPPCGSADRRPIGSASCEKCGPTSAKPLRLEASANRTAHHHRPATVPWVPNLELNTALLLRSKQDQLPLNQARPVYLCCSRFICTCHPLHHHPSSNTDAIPTACAARIVIIHAWPLLSFSFSLAFLPVQSASRALSFRSWPFNTDCVLRSMLFSSHLRGTATRIPTSRFPLALAFPLSRYPLRSFRPSELFCFSPLRF